MADELDATLKSLLLAELPKSNQIEVSFEQPKRENSAKWTKPTINLFLYDVRENNVLRQHQWARLPGGDGNGDQALLKRSPMRVDRYYMLTTWIRDDPEAEHWLLTRCMLALFRYPTLPEKFMPEDSRLRKQPFPIQTRVANHDKLTNPAEVWSALDNEIRPSVSYLVTLALDPWTEEVGKREEHIVRILTLRSGHSDTLPEEERPIQESPEANFILGTVRNKAEEGKPVVGIEVAVREAGLSARSDSKGRFSLGPLPPGEYTLVARPPQGEPKERKVVIPAPRDTKPDEGVDYDLELESA